jgi:hypothetical protein
MANFHHHPSGQNINGTNVVVDGPSITIGLWGPKDFQGRDLIVTNEGDDLAIFEAGTVGNSTLYKITVKQAIQKAKTSVSDTIYANTVDWQTWSKFNITFRMRAGASVGGAITVRAITAAVSGAGSLFRSTVTAPTYVIMTGSFKAGDPTNTPLFGLQSGKAVNVAFFAAKVGSIERAYILMVPQRHASKLLIVISHGFGQNEAFYSALNYGDPLSPALILDVMHRFVLARWGPQLMCASSDYALLMPVRAKGGGGVSELGPFVTQSGAGAEIVAQIAAQSGRVFEFGHVEIVTFSSGIHDANAFLGAGGRGLKFARGINQDPAGGTSMSAAAGVRRQYLSGGTTGGTGRAGFEFMPLSRWRNEPNSGGKLGFDTHNYLHTWCLPQYTLFLGMKT